ncbi:MAG TPA: response regulator, partial [Thermoanaerobaculia bacterium]|nr:response regulator [Thermoanaerobaculia bacterium]
MGAGAEGAAWPAALESSGRTVRAADCAGPGDVAAALRDPLDLILVWEEAGQGRAEEVFAALLREGVPVPVAVVADPEAADVPGAAAVLPREGASWLPGALERVFRRQSLETCLALTGRIAHDLNNRLAPIPLAVQLLQRTHGTPAAAGPVESIDAASRGSMGAVRELGELLVASLEGPLQVRAKHLLAIAARHWRRALSGRSGAPVGVLTDYQPDLALVRVDVPRLLQILSCLARRTLDAAPGGELLLQGRNVGERPSLGGPAVELRVACAASGVEGRLARAGLEERVGDEGPAALREVVEAQGGELWLLPAGPDQLGFAVLLPAASGGPRSFRGPGPSPRRPSPKPPGGGRSARGGKPRTVPPGPPAAPRAAAEGRPAASDGRTVLVIDADEECRRMTGETLEEYGYSVIAAADDTEGVALYAAQADGVAAVVVEYSLPYMDGPTTIKALRRIAPGVPLILVTGAEWEARRTERDRDGPDAVLRKPF